MIAALGQGRVYTPDDCAGLPSEPGAYVLLITLSEQHRGRFAGKDFTLEPGRYAYCGSAKGPGGIAARVGRHFRRDKKAHWHIDQLTIAAASISALAYPGQGECALMARLVEAGASVPFPGFGSSDCRLCAAHLACLT